MIRHLVREVAVKLLIALAVTSLVAGCGPWHFGIAEYRASHGGADPETVEQPTTTVTRAGQNGMTPPLIPQPVIRPPVSMAQRTVAPDPGSGGGGLASANVVSQPHESDAVVAVRLIDAGASRSGAWVSFGEAFRQGQLPAGSGLAARVGGREVPAQLDVQSKYPDGSARSGIVTAEAGGGSEIVLVRR